MSLSALRERLQRGGVYCAHPLALNSRRQLDARRQRALTRYYLASGARGLAVGVHTTQFELHADQGRYREVLELAAGEVGNREEPPTSQPPVLVAGLVGGPRQLLGEAAVARELGYDCGLLSFSGCKDLPEPQLVDCCREVSRTLPVFGFYLQPAVGGRTLSFDFWKGMLEVEALVAIKIAPFNRYQTLDVVRAVAESGRAAEVALFTGNDDNIVGDLLTPFAFPVSGRCVQLRMVGGLLGQRAVWTSRAVEMAERIREISHTGRVPADLLRLNAELTDANAAIFDARNGFRGCIPGIHEVLRRQGLLEGVWCLDLDLHLSPGQPEALERVWRAYPHLNDDAFVAEHLDLWLKG